MKTTHILLLLAVATTATGCLMKDMTECAYPRGNVRISVDLDPEVAGGKRHGLDAYTIDNARVFVFDAAGNYITSSTGVAYAGSEYKILLNLAAGSYDFVVWTNEGDVYKARGTSALTDMELYLDHGGRPLTSPIPDLLYGAARGRTIVPGIDNRVEVAMRPNTYTVNIKARGLGGNADLYETTVTNNRSHYTFDNAIIEGKAKYVHLRTLTDTDADGEVNTTIKMLRLSHEGHPQLTFRNATDGNVLFTECLPQTIVAAYAAQGQTVDFSRTFTFDIVLTFDAALGVTVSVNGWEYTIDNAELE